MFHRLDYGEVLRRELKFMDATAVSLCMDNDLPIVVFDLMGEGNVVRAVRGERIGTLVSRYGRRQARSPDAAARADYADARGAPTGTTRRSRSD